MIILGSMPNSPVWSEALFDSAMLVVLLFPVLYFLIFRPFVHQIDYLNKAEQTVRESEARFKQIFEGSPIGIAAYDDDGRLLKSNQALKSPICPMRTLEKISLTCLITLNTVPAGSAKSYPV